MKFHYSYLTPLLALVALAPESPDAEPVPGVEMVSGDIAGVQHGHAQRRAHHDTGGRRASRKKGCAALRPTRIAGSAVKR